MHVIECSTFDSAKLVIELLAKLGGGNSATLKGEGKYVSTVSLATATLCSEHMHHCKVVSWSAHPSDVNTLNRSVVPSLTVSFQGLDVGVSSVPAPSTPYKTLPSPIQAFSATSVDGALPSPVFNS
eukprot:TRINITY_DN25333_c0_g1_i1.p1 TRINITY_DN25333_c0_g1~~TRINITY_DN25333_c0_g1_i1.p1  ORF type:complete len:145 (+),score=20.96 TRINITY_DN25333_c0_g1_i1:58-435(+)